MWVRIKGTECGVAVDVDPNGPVEDNRNLAISTVRSRLKEIGLIHIAARLKPGDFIAGEVEYELLERIRHELEGTTR